MWIAQNSLEAERAAGGKQFNSDQFRDLSGFVGMRCCVFRAKLSKRNRVRIHEGDGNVF